MKYVVLICCAIGVRSLSLAQSGLNSIYSAYGIGDVNIRDYTGFSGMGGLGVAMPSTNTLNDLNPASYGSFPLSRLMLELSFGGKSVNYVNSTQNISAGDFTVRKAALGFSLFRNWGTSFGIKRYSDVEYYTLGNRFLLGTNSKLTSEIKGNGGLYEFFFSNGLKLGKHLNLGLTMGYLSGSVNRKETINTDGSQGVVVDKNDFYQNFYFNTGFQYKFKTGDYSWILGGTFQPQRSLNKTEDNTIQDLNGNTLVQQASILGKFNFPVQWGGGLTMLADDWKIGVDYIGQNWQSVHYAGPGFQTTNSGNWAAGVSYGQPRKTVFGMMDGPTYSAGLNYDQSYLVINGQQIKTIAGTIGISLPSRSGFYQYHFGLKAGQRGSKTYPMVRENFVEFNANISLSSLIYTGGRKYE